MVGPIDYNNARNYVFPRLQPWGVRWYLHKRPIIDSLVRAKPYLLGELLDIGCGSMPYRGFLNLPKYRGIDIAASPHNVSQADQIFDGATIPYPDECFDSVLCTEVLEHSSQPEKLMDEIKRVLKVGGAALITVPMVIEHHEAPFDMRRFTFHGLKALADERGFDIHWLDPRGGVVNVALYSIYLTVEQSVSRRPVLDVIFYLIFPFAYLAIKLDKRFKRRPPPISLGWQMLITKGHS